MKINIDSDGENQRSIMKTGYGGVGPGAFGIGT